VSSAVTLMMQKQISQIGVARDSRTFTAL